MIPATIVTLLSLTSVSYLTIAAIAPQTAQAYTARIEVSLTRQSEESYQDLLRRAEAVARAATQRSLDGDILVTEVAVTITGQNGGAIAPILLLEVSRSNWKRRPDPQLWATYFPNTQLLLGFTEIETEEESPPVPPPAADDNTPSGAPPPPVDGNTPSAAPPPPESFPQEADPDFIED
ncbi:MAG: hypothetical protein F6J86_31375 [Symploca sp. SIO1B1]|nr:hypothetical protein [Symploca sp. SIO1C2]NER98278.1 hypothetical protein [Symploca sp. SIO1B1]